MLHYKSCCTPISLNAKISQQDGLVFENLTLYRSVISALQYLCNTRPYISFTVNKLSQFLSNPLYSPWIACKRVLRYLKGTLNLIFLFLPSASFLTLHAFSDADCESSLNDWKSTIGSCVFLGDIRYFLVRRNNQYCKIMHKGRISSLSLCLHCNCLT